MNLQDARDNMSYEILMSAKHSLRDAYYGDFTTLDLDEYLEIQSGLRKQLVEIKVQEVFKATVVSNVGGK